MFTALSTPEPLNNFLLTDTNQFRYSYIHPQMKCLQGLLAPNCQLQLICRLQRAGHIKSMHGNCSHYLRGEYRAITEITLQIWWNNIVKFYCQFCHSTDFARLFCTVEFQRTYFSILQTIIIELLMGKVLTVFAVNLVKMFSRLPCRNESNELRRRNLEIRIITYQYLILKLSPKSPSNHKFQTRR